MRFLILLLLIPFVTAAPEGHMVLLTVGEDLKEGGTADLYLEVRRGSGKIFIDSFPLTRVDTQGSTRYANQIACDFLQVDCTHYDFFYTIRADSAIVGGPSAGAAIAALTVAVLDGQEVRQDMALTGTINSGGIIGPVGGVKDKVEGAKEVGITHVLIPLLSTINTTENVTFVQERGIVEELSDEDVTVIRVGVLEEALELFTGKNYARDLPEVRVPEEYDQIMRNVANDICERNNKLREAIAKRELVYNDSNNYTRRIEQLPANREYSRASLCFSSNIELNRLVLANTTQETLAERYWELLRAVTLLDAQLDNRTIATITDLEVYAIVKERVLEAKEILHELNQSDLESSSLAYAEERMTSALSWSKFFAMPGQIVSLDRDHLHKVCLTKIAEAEERIGYVSVYSSTLITTSRGTLDEAYRYVNREPIICIFTASKAKAQATLVSSALFLDSEDIHGLVQEKLRADELVLRKQAEKGFFPLLGYSYMNYAEDLLQEQPFSALTFAEYALELSNLDLYFPKETKRPLSKKAKEGVLLFIFGALFGAGVSLLIVRKRLLSTMKRKRK